MKKHLATLILITVGAVLYMGVYELGRLKGHADDLDAATETIQECLDALDGAAINLDEAYYAYLRLHESFGSLQISFDQQVQVNLELLNTVEVTMELLNAYENEGD